MPRKTSSSATAPITSIVRFNEAAARCRGKPVVGRPLDLRGPLASMRPRPDAAENRLASESMRPLRSQASMRPRPDAAENRPGEAR